MNDLNEGTTRMITLSSAPCEQESIVILRKEQAVCMTQDARTAVCFSMNTGL